MDLLKTIDELEFDFYARVGLDVSDDSHALRKQKEDINKLFQRDLFSI